MGFCTLFCPELASCDMGSFASWKNELQGVVPAWLINGVRTVRSGIQRLCAGELYGEACPLGGGVDPLGPEITSCRLGPLKWAKRCWQALIDWLTPSCFTSGTV